MPTSKLLRNSLGHPLSPLGLPIVAIFAFIVVQASGSASRLAAQAVVVDEGSFSISHHGEPAGREEFFIRKRTDAAGSYLANATVELWAWGGERTLSTLLTAHAPGGSSLGYELSVTEAEAPFRIAIPVVAAPRFTSHYVSANGQETREYAGEPGTRILEAFVAHHHFALASLDLGSSVPVIVPGEKTAGHLRLSDSEEVEIVVGGLAVRTRKLSLAGLGGERLIWFDALGRVIRTEIPALGYAAERTDLGMAASSSEPPAPDQAETVARVGS